jgi:clan AA aspartic protease
MPGTGRTTVPRVGVTFTRVTLSNPRRSDLAPVELDFLIDTGATCSVVPASVLEALGIARLERQDFTLADGTRQAYDIGEAFFELGARGRTSQVVFAPEGVTPLLGAFTLESLGLMVNPVTRELLPMRLFLAACPLRAPGGVALPQARGRSGGGAALRSKRPAAPTSPAAGIRSRRSGSRTA